MAFTYDIEKDLRFKEGKRRGEREGELRGELRGEEKGELKTKIQAIKTMLKNGLDTENIAIYLNVSIEFVENIRKGNE
jgi:predicted transposase YdaD